MKLANKITLARIILAPIIFFLIIYEKSLAALVIVIIAFLTDILDGYVARKQKQETKTGEILDSAADKILILFIAIAFLVKANFNLSETLLFLTREILLTAIVLISLIFSIKNLDFKSRISGKLVTLVQAVTIVLVIIGFKEYIYLIYAVFVLAVITIVHYLYINRKALKRC